MSESTYVVMQRNSAGVVSLTSGQLPDEQEAFDLVLRKAKDNPTLEYQIVALTPTMGWASERSLR